MPGKESAEKSPGATENSSPHRWVKGYLILGLDTSSILTYRVQ